MPCRIFSCGVQILGFSVWALVPRPESNLDPLHWERGGLVIGPPGQKMMDTGKDIRHVKKKKQEVAGKNGPGPVELVSVI